MEIIHKGVAGLDVHQATVVAWVRVMAGGEAVRACRTFATTTDGLLALLAWLEANRCTHVAMAATGVYWKPVWKILSAGDFELIVANAAPIKNVPGRKSDLNPRVRRRRPEGRMRCGVPIGWRAACSKRASCRTRTCRTCAR
jgi:transposase